MKKYKVTLVIQDKSNIEFDALLDIIEYLHIDHEDMEIDLDSDLLDVEVIE